MAHESGTEQGPGDELAVMVIMRREHWLACSHAVPLEKCEKEGKHRDDAEWLVQTLKQYLG